MAAAITGVPLVVTRRVSFPIKRPLLWKVPKRVIAVSRAAAQSAIAAGVKAERLVVIPDAIDPQEFLHPAVDIRRRIGLSPNVPVAVALGALTPEKDHATIIAAAALLVRDLPDLHWVIVGEGPLRPELENQLKALAVPGTVHLIGELSDPHLALSGANVFVLSSVAEGLGSSILAAMAAGVPVVATRVGGVPDLLENGVGILIDPGNPASLAAAVRQVLTNPAISESLTLAGKARLPMYTVEAVAKQVSDVYRSEIHSLDGS
jgi:glycosyltransferase involved in cell wall biosynthesis